MKYAVFAMLLIILISGCVQTPINANVQTNVNTTGGAQITENKTQTTVEKPAIANVELSGYEYIPYKLTVKKGTTVAWTNADTASHTISGSALKKTSGTLRPGDSWNYTFDTPGTFNYYCAIHFEKGKVIVE